MGRGGEVSHHAWRGNVLCARVLSVKPRLGPLPKSLAGGLRCIGGPRAAVRDGGPRRGKRLLQICNASTYSRLATIRPEPTAFSNNLAFFRCGIVWNAEKRRTPVTLTRQVLQWGQRLPWGPSSESAHGVGPAHAVVPSHGVACLRGLRVNSRECQKHTRVAKNLTASAQPVVRAARDQKVAGGVF